MPRHPSGLRLTFFASLALATSVAFGITSGSARAQAQNQREGQGQTPQDQSHPLPVLQDYSEPGKIPSLSDILKNIHGSYSVSFMGPRLTGDTDETYNVYIPDVAPVQLYHTFKMGYQVSPDLQIGVDEAIVNNVVDGTGQDLDYNGNPVTYHKSFQWYDPNIYFAMPNLVKVEGWNIFTEASFSLPLSQDSVDQKRITQIIVTQSWTKNNFPSDWSYGFHLYFNPQFYSDPMPSGYSSRETFSFSFGHNLSYRVSELFQISTSTTFDVQHNSPDPNGFLHLSDGLPDYFTLKATLFPQIYPLWMSISGYMQFLFWNPSWDTAIVGCGLSIGF